MYVLLYTFFLCIMDPFLSTARKINSRLLSLWTGDVTFFLQKKKKEMAKKDRKGNTYVLSRVTIVQE